MHESSAQPLVTTACQVNMSQEGKQHWLLKAESDKGFSYL